MNSYNLATTIKVQNWSKNWNKHFSKEGIQMANKHMKRCVIALVIREMQIKTTVGYYFTSTRMTFFFNLFIFILGCVGSLLLRRLSLVAASGGYSLLRCAGFSLRWLLLLQSMGSRRAGFSSCGAWAQWLWLVGSRAQAQ